ncbi:MAG: mucoidy inhibitor MuiA family protein [Bacteroidales bacterium]|nr:mucoidy inhibitor MuiA family protein [Bacteroidales bacterium]
MKTTLFFAALMTSLVLVAQSSPEKEMPTKIEEVTVFLNGAQVFETGKITIPAGKTLVRVKDLSPHLEEQSIQVKAEGDFTILSVNHKMNFLSELKRNATADSLNLAIEKISLSILNDNARLEVLKEMLNLLAVNRSMGQENAGVSLTQLKEALTLYETEISKIKLEEIKITNSIVSKKDEQKKLQDQLKGISDQLELPSSEIEILVRSDKQLDAKFFINYIVGNAGWFPKYDIRVSDIESPLELTYKAEVFQNTGVDWKNVKLRFSNGDPRLSGQIPNLEPWRLNYARYTTISSDRAGTMAPGNIQQVRGVVFDSQTREPVPFANVVVKGTSIGTTSDFDGRYDLMVPPDATHLQVTFVGYKPKEILIDAANINIPLDLAALALEEFVVGSMPSRVAGVQVTSYAIPKQKAIAQPVRTTMKEYQTTVEIEVDEPYSVKSGGEKLGVDLRKYQIEADYTYQVVPKVDKDAFLIARITNWDQYNLLQGEANLYYEETYVGRSILDTRAIQDTLAISLGRDQNIVVRREKVEQFSRRRILGSNMLDSRGFNITVRNTKSQPVKITVFDQVPVSVVSDISVAITELSGAKHDEQSGKISWELNLAPQEQKELNFQYEVKYPGRERVIFE